MGGKGINEQVVMRTFAWLLRNERVRPEAIERAVTSAIDMAPGQSVALTGDEPQAAPLRRAFVQEQTQRLKNA